MDVAAFVVLNYPQIWSLSAARDIGEITMLPTTIVIDDKPRCVVRPNDMKDLQRFLRNGKAYLLADNPTGAIGFRGATEEEAIKWRSAFALHKAWSGGEEEFFGVPL